MTAISHSFSHLLVIAGVPILIPLGFVGFISHGTVFLFVVIQTLSNSSSTSVQDIHNSEKSNNNK